MDNSTTDDQLRENRLARQREYSRKWYIANKEMVNTKSKQYYNENKDQCHEHHRKWKARNQDACKQYSHDYYLQNKEAMKAKFSTPYSCNLCGGRYTYVHKSDHLRTHKHALALKHKIEQEQTTTDLPTTEN